MKKDYSKNKIINKSGICFPNIIGNILSIIIAFIITIIFKLKSEYSMIILGFINAFIGLELGGKILDKNCTNNDIKKCKKCGLWNCCRELKK